MLFVIDVPLLAGGKAHPRNPGDPGDLVRRFLR